MKKLVVLLAALILPFVVVVFAAPQAVDLAGIWKGTTGVPSGETDEVTMTLEKSEGTYKGKISDSLGLVTDADISNVAFADQKLTFDFYLDEGVPISVELTLTDGKLVGSWSNDEGSSSGMEFVREAK